MTFVSGRFGSHVTSPSFLAVGKESFSARRFASQLLDSASSIGANLEEADGAQSRADFISKCTIALKESRESHYWLRLLQRTGKLREERLLKECNELIAILTTIVRKSRRE